MEKKTRFLLLGSFISLIVALGIFVLSYNRIHALKLKEMELRGETQMWVKKSKQMSTFYNVLEAASEIEKEVQKEYFTPTEEAQIQFIADIEGYIKKSGAIGEVRSLEVSPAAKTVMGNIYIVGDWDSVFRAIRIIEAFPIHMNVNDVSIAEGGAMIKPSSGGRALVPEYRATIQFSIIHINPLP